MNPKPACEKFFAAPGARSGLSRAVDVDYLTVIYSGPHHAGPAIAACVQNGVRHSRVFVNDESARAYLGSIARMRVCVDQLTPTDRVVTTKLDAMNFDDLSVEDC